MAKRVSLKEFQESLVQRLNSARTGEASSALLGIQSGGENWLLDLADSAEIVPLPGLTHVPLTKPWFRGLANVRGTLYTVVDFAAFQGREPTPTGADARLLLPHARYAGGAALLVSRALGLRSRDTFFVEHRSDPRPWVAEELKDSQGQVWRKLSLDALLTHPDFFDVGL